MTRIRRASMSQDELSTKGNPLSRWPESRLTRRQMIQRLGVLGIALPTLPAILEACGGEAAPTVTALSQNTSGSITGWGGEESLNALKLGDSQFASTDPKVTS